MHPSSRAVNSARELGPWTRVVETDLYRACWFRLSSFLRIAYVVVFFLNKGQLLSLYVIGLVLCVFCALFGCRSTVPVQSIAWRDSSLNFIRLSVEWDITLYTYSLTYSYDTVCSVLINEHDDDDDDDAVNPFRLSVHLVVGLYH